MTDAKHLIIPILVQDMKHEQLMAGLKRLGFHSDLHYLDLMGVVAELMRIPEAEMNWEWCDVYISFLKQAKQYEVTGDGKNLLPLAEACYAALVIVQSGKMY